MNNIHRIRLIINRAEVLYTWIKKKKEERVELPSMYDHAEGSMVLYVYFIRDLLVIRIRHFQMTNGCQWILFSWAADKHKHDVKL